MIYTKIISLLISFSTTDLPQIKVNDLLVVELAELVVEVDVLEDILVTEELLHFKDTGITLLDVLGFHLCLGFLLLHQGFHFDWDGLDFGWDWHFLALHCGYWFFLLFGLRNGFFDG